VTYFHSLHGKWSSVDRGQKHMKLIIFRERGRQGREHNESRQDRSSQVHLEM
jgi:hypothetical protein